MHKARKEQIDAFLQNWKEGKPLERGAFWLDAVDVIELIVNSRIIPNYFSTNHKCPKDDETCLVFHPGIDCWVDAIYEASPTNQGAFRTNDDYLIAPKFWMPMPQRPK